MRQGNGKEPTYSLAQLDFILKHHTELTVKETAEHLKLKVYIVAGIGYRYNLPFKKANEKRKQSPGPEDKLRHVIPASLLPDPEPVKSFRRAPAEYSNAGYISTAKRYNL